MKSSMKKRNINYFTYLVTMIFVLSSDCFAQSYPNKPMRVIVPFPSGGPTDIVGRVIGEALGLRLNQVVVVENKPGAGSSIGTDAVVKSPPDGYTLLLGSSSLAINPIMIPNLPYDASKDLAPIGLVARIPGLLAVNPALNVHNVKELIALAKANPDKINYGTSGLGTADHLIGVLFTSEAGIKMRDVPYKGSPQMLTDLVGGQVDLTFNAISTVLPHVRSGRLRAVGVTSGQRSPSAKEIPTISEQGLPTFQISSWFGLFAPSQTPIEVLDTINKEIIAVSQLPVIREKFSSVGVDIETSSREQFTTLIKDDTLRWSKLAKEKNLKFE